MSINIAYKHKSNVNTNQPRDSDPDSSSFGSFESLASSSSAWRRQQCSQGDKENNLVAKTGFQDPMTHSLAQPLSIQKSYKDQRDSQPICKGRVSGPGLSSKPLNPMQLKTTPGNGKTVTTASGVCSKSNVVSSPEQHGLNDRCK